ncbi:hypothetical protein HYV10_03420 [Candidatus Dependentiae bacterium]|nr:hypothetical protein [Candidatus Dependentiae bacterium]
MNYIRLYSALLCALCISLLQTSIVTPSFLAEIGGKDAAGLTEYIGNMSENDIANLSKDEMNALAGRLAELSKGNEAVFGKFLKDDSELSKNSNFASFKGSFNSQVDAINRANAEQAVVGDELEGLASDEAVTKGSYTRVRDKLDKTFDNVNDFIDELSKSDVLGGREFKGGVRTDADTFASQAREIANIGSLEKAQSLGKNFKLGEKATSLQQSMWSKAEKKLSEATDKDQARSALITLRRIQRDVKINDLPRDLQVAARKANGVMCDKFDKFLEDVKDPNAKVKVEELPGGKIAKGGEAGGIVVEITKLEDFLATTIKEDSQAFRRDAEKYLDKQTNLFRTEIAGKLSDDLSYADRLSWRSDVKFLEKKLDDFREKNVEFDKKVEEGVGGRGGWLSRTGRWIGGKFLFSLETLGTAILFMIPNIFQSAYLSQQEKAALLATWGKVIKYGDRVWVVLAWCINLENPSASIPLLVQIPVSSTDEPINATLAKMFANTINQGAPTSNNPISDAIHNASADFWTEGASTGTKIKRYIFSNEFLKYTDIAVMYGSPTSMAPTASAMVGTSQFTGNLVSLKTGQVINGSGGTVNATGIPQETGIPLIAGDDSTNIWGTLSVGQTTPAAQGLKPIIEIFGKLLDKMEALGIKVNFQQYQDVTTGYSAHTVGKSQAAYFDADCIDEKSGAVKVSGCRCLLTEALTDLQNGLELDAAGKVAYVTYSVSSSTEQEVGDVVGGRTNVLATEQGASDQTIDATSLAKSKSASVSEKNSSSVPTSATKVSQKVGWHGLGAVIPVFGWGETGYPRIIGKTKLDPISNKNLISAGIFKGFDPSAVDFEGVSKVVTASDETTTTEREYAHPDTVWAAQGCWIYLCAQTPFIEALMKAVPGATASVVGGLTDMIVFFDSDFNVVPLMVPGTVDIAYEDESNNYSYKKSEFIVNPVIAYWTSLVFYNQSYFLSGGKPVVFDLQGNKYEVPFSELGTPPDAKKAGGAIPLFLNSTQGPSISSNYANIYNQLQVHSAALLYLLGNLDMTIGGVLFKQSDFKINVQGQNLPTYTADKSFPCFNTSNVPDLFVATDNNLNPIALPNSNLLYMQSLVTDITYMFDSKTNSWSPASSLPQSSPGQVATGYSSSSLKLNQATQMPVRKADGSYEINQQMSSYLQLLGTYLGITNTTLDGTLATQPLSQGYLTVNTTAKNDPADEKIITANQKVVTYVQKQRLKWLAGLDDVVQVGTGANSQLANLANTLTIGYAKSNKCYIYEINPGLSLASSDYFVVIDNQNPSLTTLTQTLDLKKLPKNSKAMIVSLLTGTLYDLSGNQVLRNNGFAKTVIIPNNLYASGKSTAEIIYDTVVVKFNNLPTPFKEAYKSSVDGYIQSQMVPQGPYSFGKYKVSIRAVDQQALNFVYFDAAQMTKSVIVPEDMYVIVEQDKFSPESYDSSKKQLLISLITGIAIDNSGTIVNRLSQANLKNITTTMQAGWSPWIKENVARLQAAYQASQIQMQNDQENFEKSIADFAKKHDTAMNKDQDKIAKIIKNIQPSIGQLPAPYAGLAYDKASRNYVHPSPLEKGELIYLFMNNGKIYNQDGSYLSSYQPEHIQAVRDEYGVIVDPKTGKQKLGIPMMQPTLAMQDDDLNITIGQSGESLIASGSLEFPGEAVTMPTGYGLYFSKIMNTYYVLDGKNNRWMSVDGGHLYQKNGQPVLEDNSVALSKDQIPLLLYKNKNGFMQAYMTDGSDYANISESNAAMTWYGRSEPFKMYNVTTNANSAEAIPTKYTIVDSSNESTVYTVNKNYTWNMLLLVPIDNAGNLLSNIPDDSYRYLQVVKNNNKKITHCIYNGAAYESIASAETQEGDYTVYKFKPMQETATSQASITLTDGPLDSDTTAPYMTLSDGVNTYKYAYIPKFYTTEEQEVNRVEIIHGVTAASPLPIDIGPMDTVAKEVVVPDYVTHVLFVADLPVKSNKVQVSPAGISLVYDAPKENPEAEEFAYKFASGKSGYGGVFKTSEKNPRFMYKIAGSLSKALPSTMTFDYIAKDAYVDLKTSAVYDAMNGEALGQCLTTKDFLSVLDACSVGVSNKTIEIKNSRTGKMTTVNKLGHNMLVYRSVAVAENEEETIENQSELVASKA